MADVIRIKRRSSAGAAGAPTSLAAAEIAFNEKDNVLYYGAGNNSGNAVTILPIAGPGAFLPLSGGTVAGNLTVTGTTALGAATATAPATADDSTRIATTAWVRLQGYGAGGGGASVTISDTAPVAPTAGALWFDSTQLDLYIRYADADSSQWIPVTSPAPSSGGAAYLPLSGGVLTGPLSTKGALPAGGGWVESIYAGPITVSHIAWNVYLNAANTAWLRKTGTGSGGIIQYYNDQFSFITSPSGAADSTAALTSIATIDNMGLILNPNPTWTRIVISSGAGQTSQILGAKSGSSRWELQLGTGESETGGNVGSNFYINRYADNGSYIGAALSINRANGVAGFGAAISVPGNISGYNFVITNQAVGDAGTFGFTNGNGASVIIYGNSSAGAGRMDFTTSGTQRGWIDINGRWNINSQLSMQPILGSTQYTNALFFQTNYANDAFYIQGYHNPGVEASLNFVNTSKICKIDNAGNWWVVNGTGYKPGGGVWADSSDIRTKEDIQDYTRGLSAITKLNPVTYKKNGLRGTIKDGKTYIGLVADHVRDIMPEMVGIEHTLTEQEDPTLTVDATAVIYALINSCKELAQKVNELEDRLNSL